LALRAAGVGAGDEVITVANTATPTVSAIRMAGATPRFVDVSRETQLMNPALLGAAINRKTRAIVPVHLFGYPAELRPIKRVAKAHGLAVIEDASQAHGARYFGRNLGCIGDAGCFSFYPTKNLGAFGDAGAVVTNNAKLAAQIRMLRNYGEVSKYSNAVEGVNSRLDEVQASWLNWGLDHIDQWSRRRAELASEYLRRLEGANVVLPPSGDRNHLPAWHLFVIQSEHRDELREHLSRAGIGTAIHYPTAIDQQPAYAQFRARPNALPETHAFSGRILSLPLYPELTIKEVRAVCAAIRSFSARNGRSR
ncbi:MAG: DegT/DnrJ/EryC1/StrS family aminotransferase, partial [Chthoniobacterales bacterium]